MGIVHRTDHSITWGVDDQGLLACRSHALRDDDGRVWIIDPVEMVGLDDAIRAMGEPAGVIVLLDRHLRAAPAVASRLGVPLYFPEGTQRQRLPEDVVRYADQIDGCPFEFPLVRQSGRAWIERALWWPAQRLLVIAEAVGTVDYFRAHAGDVCGLHPMMHARPPRGLMGFDPELVLVGHGDPLERPGEAIDQVIMRGRRDMGAVMLRMPRLLAAATGAIRRGQGGC